jgi:hypothetical protein
VRSLPFICLAGCVLIPIVVAQSLGITVKQLFVNAWLEAKELLR